MKQYFYEPVNMEVWPEFWQEKEGNTITHLACSSAKMQIGDVVLLFVTGASGGLHAIGEVISQEYLYLEGKNEKTNPCFDKKVVDIKLYKFSTTPLVHPDETRNLVKGSIRPYLLGEIGDRLYNKVYGIDGKALCNEPRVENSDDWLGVLKSEEVKNNKIFDIFAFMLVAKGRTSTKERIAEYLGTSKNKVVSIIDDFGKSAVESLHLEEQYEENGDSRYWNVPFLTVYHKNENEFTWKLRDELVEALRKLYPEIDEQGDIEGLIANYIKNNPIDEFEESIKDELEIRQHFVERFSLESIKDMELEDYCIGRKSIDEQGENSFCYLLERRMPKLGGMLGANASKFGVYFNKDGEFKPAKKYDEDFLKAFDLVKLEIMKLLQSGGIRDYEGIAKNKIPDVYKGKILSTYYPEYYLPVFDPRKVEIYLTLLHIDYDPKEYKTLEEKKLLLKRYKESLNKKMSDYYFVTMLGDLFQVEFNEDATDFEKISQNLHLVDFELLQAHQKETREKFRPRSTDYIANAKRNKVVGDKGEALVFNFEKDKLVTADRADLADQVVRVFNDALGYDIESFEVDGTPLHIEVKTHRAKVTNHLEFYFTANELERLRVDEHYKIYFLFDLGKKTKYYVIDRNTILDNEKSFLQPIAYKFDVDIKEIS